MLPPVKSRLELGSGSIQFIIKVCTSVYSGVVDAHREMTAILLIVRTQPHLITLHQSHLHAQYSTIKAALIAHHLKDL